ncbi:MAG: TIGR03617 family F420-dependent LLM class oxidoreductase [Halieaceae bacterium]|nr:TIGR03617 family F420-dependent LLM class oxidoreductase [Halieaceae bacterium]
MKIDGPLYAPLAEAGNDARRLQALGYDGVYTLEGPSDPFLPLAIASQQCPGLDIATSIAVAFPRNPAHTAYQAWDLQRLSGGRFRLGLGSQVRAHIEKRFGVDFNPPAARMAEYIRAVRAHFDCWQEGAELAFEGEYFRHTLMTPMFNPGPLDTGPPPIYLGAVGPKMTAVAGAVADGLIVHPFHSQPFLRDGQLPALASAVAEAGRDPGACAVQVSAIVVTGSTEEECRAADASVRGLLAFYGSTPAYLPALEAIGQGALQKELNRLSKAGRWEEMSALVDDGLLEAFAICGEPATIAAGLAGRYGDIADRLGIYAPYSLPDATWQAILSDLKAIA